MEEPKISQEYISNPVCGATAGEQNAALPKEVSVWSKIKAFLLQDVNREVVITMTPYQEKVLREVHDFWFQEVNFGKVKDLITFGKKSK